MMKIKHKFEYIVMLGVCLLLLFAFQQTVVTYGIEGKNAYKEHWKLSETQSIIDNIQMIEDLKQSIRQDRKYFFYVGEAKVAEYASLDSILKTHPLGYVFGEAGPVTYIEIKEVSVLNLMIVSQSNQTKDWIEFKIETYDGQEIYKHVGMNESFQEEIELEPGIYLFSKGSKTNNSQFKLSMKYALDLQ